MNSSIEIASVSGENEMDSRAAGVLLAAAAGDALGWTTEFMRSPADLRSRLNVDQITDFLSWRKRVGGKFHGYEDQIAAGEYSDDTQLTICTAASIDQHGLFDPLQFSKLEFPAWLEYARGAGGTVKFAADRCGLKGTQWHANFFKRKTKDASLDYRDGGANGAAMRIAPHVLANVDNWAQAENDIWANAIISHGHPRAIIGALLYGHALHTVLQQTSEVDGRDLIQSTANATKRLSIPSNPPFDTWRQLWNEGRAQSFEAVYALTMQEAIEHLRTIWRALRDALDPRQALQELGCFNPATKGSGLATALAGIYLYARQPKDARENILLAVNMIGSDTDSIAAFVGGLQGAACGLAAIPEEWHNQIQDGPYLISLGHYLSAVARRQPTTVCPHPGWAGIKPGPAMAGQDLALEMDVVHRLLGIGKIVGVSRQTTLSQGREVTLARIQFQVGQSCLFPLRGTARSANLCIYSG